MHIYELRKLVGREETTYTELKGLLRGYSQPKNKVSAWIKSGDLIRVKQGIYIFNPKLTDDFYSKELLASWMYGPSIISLHYALGWYSLIPEIVHDITSITTKRSKKFITPVGTFSYKHCSVKKFMVGVVSMEVLKYTNVLMATKEKAIADFLYHCTESLDDVQEMEEHILDNMRMNEDVLSEIDKVLLGKIADTYKNNNVNLFKEWIYRNYV